MIEYKVGNLLDTDDYFIGHGCNAQGKMGSGVAKAIRDKWPAVYEEYRQRYEEYGLKTGETVIVHLSYDDPVILNFITQEFYGNDGKVYVDYDAIRTCLRNLETSIQNALEDAYYDRDFMSLSLPKIGAGLAGGDWDKIAQIIEEEIKGPVTVYVLDPKEIPDGV